MKGKRSSKSPLFFCDSLARSIFLATGPGRKAKGRATTIRKNSRWKRSVCIYRHDLARSRLMYV